jgi:hypothetical protein
MTTPNVFYSHYPIHPIAITSHDHTRGFLLALSNPASIVTTSTWPNPSSFTPTTQSTQLPSPHMISTANKGQKISDVWKFGPKSASQESCTILVSQIWNESWGANLSDTASRILMKKWFVVWTLDSFCHIFLSIRSGLEIDKGQSCTLQKRATVNPALCNEGFDWELPFRGKKKLVKWREIRWPYSKEVDKICICFLFIIL